MQKKIKHIRIFLSTVFTNTTDRWPHSHPRTVHPCSPVPILWLHNCQSGRRRKLNNSSSLASLRKPPFTGRSLGHHCRLTVEKSCHCCAGTRDQRCFFFFCPLFPLPVMRQTKPLQPFQGHN